MQTQEKKILLLLKNNFTEKKTQKLFIMALIKAEIRTGPKVLYAKSCTRHQFLFCKKMLSKIEIFLA